MKTINEIRKESIKKDFIVNNLMKSNGLYCLVARPKVGKSLLALQLANSVATGTSFLGKRTNQSPVLYISTEMDSMQILNRIDKMGLQFNDENFLLIEQNPNERKLNLMDLQYQFQEFATNHNGKLVIIDMFSGIGLNSGYDLNNYQDMGQVVIPKFRELCKKFNFTILLVHHLNKKNTSLGSTAIDGSVDGKITLKLDNNLKNKILFNYESRDYEGFDLILTRNENLLFDVSQSENEDLSYNILLFLNYAIKQQEFTFTASEITSKLNLQITPSAFGRLLMNNIEELEKEGLYIEQRRSANERTYYAKYKEPNYEYK
ncbi:MAG: AAA family ATPase [Bacilli bacterium]|nr:AAA family ATPase [Bacilli bacterium]